MKRLHLFEIEDFNWYPNILREPQTDYLRFLMGTFNVFRAVVPTIKNAIETTGRNHLLDYCSGGGGSMLLVRKYLKEEGIPFKATLTDLYPNITAFKYVQSKSEGDIDYISNPVNALNPEKIDGYDKSKVFRTIFNGFHHFRPGECVSILQKAVDDREPIGIFEPLEKSIIQILINLVALTVLMWLATPFIRPFKWSRIIFTYLIPIVPLVTLWDGIVSVIRLYTPKMMDKLITEVKGHEQYEWKTGIDSHTFGKVIYLIGYPKKEV